jgi:regulator of RNase E activity RraA
MKSNTDFSLFERIKILYTGLISDVLDDKFGCRNQRYIMDYHIRPLYSGAVVVGRAATALCAPIFKEVEDPYKMQLDFVDSLQSGDVVVASQNGVMTAGLWGGLLSTAAKQRGALGAVIDGITRDTRDIKRLKFPVFVKGIAPGDSKGRLEIMNFNEPIQCGGVWVDPGDIVFGDDDGVVVIPGDIFAEVVELAEEKHEKEKQFMNGLRQGSTIKEMFQKYRVL